MNPRIYLQQRALADMGLYHGKLDGIPGPFTETAYGKFVSTLSTAPGEISFEETVAGWGLRYFSAAELLVKGGAHARNKLNTDPPRNLWGNIRAAAVAADEARERLGSGILITSAYRSSAYNKAIGGAKGSYHMQFRALDLIPVKATVAKLHATLKQLRKEGFKGAGGIGRYKTFCHLDNGPARDF